jgi:hypothetical protein
MSSPEPLVVSSLDDAAPRISALADQAVADGAIETVSDEAVQQLLHAAVRLYAAKRDAGSKLAAFAGAGDVTATEVAVTCVGMTAVVNLELFELALWAGWSNI